MSATRTEDCAEMTLEELEAAHERINARRGELIGRRKRIEADGTPNRVDLRHVERQLDDLDDDQWRLQPFLDDARAEQSERIRRASRIDQLEHDVEVLDDLLKFRDSLERLVAEHLEPHLGKWHRGFGLSTAGSKEWFAKLARDVLPGGRAHMNGAYNTAGQLRVERDKAVRELEQLRAEARADAEVGA